MGTTLTNLSVAFNLNAVGVKSGVTLARNEIASLGRLLRSQETDVQRYERSLTLLEKAHKSGTLIWSQFRGEVDKLKTSYGRNLQVNQQLINSERLKQHALDAAAQAMTRQKNASMALEAQQKRLSEAARLTAQAQQLQTRQTGLATTAYLGLGRVIAAVGFVRLAKETITLAADFETLNIQFEVLLGSAEKAGIAIRDLRTFAAASPLKMADVTQGMRTLLAFGVASERAMLAVKMLGDISLGNAERFGRLTYAFGQISAAGKLMGTEVRQLTEVGFNPLQEMARTTGKGMEELRQAMSDGAISADMVFNALQSATSAGGLFHGMTDRLAKTTSGQLAQSMDQLQLVGIQIGNELIPVLTDVLGIFKETGTAVNDLVGSVGKLAEGLRIVGGFFADLEAVGEGLGMSARGYYDWAAGGDFSKWRETEAAAKAKFFQGLTGTATSAALDNTIVQSAKRTSAIRDKSLMFDPLAATRDPKSTMAELRAKGDWVEIQRRQEVFNKRAAEMAAQRQALMKQQLEAQRKTNALLEKQPKLTRAR